jgi:hypothetical protein
VPVKRRTNKRRDAITSDEAVWLRGDRDCGFVEFKRPEELQKLWDGNGDQETMYWEAGMSRPELIDEHTC